MQQLKWRVLLFILLWSAHAYAEPIPVDQAFNFSAIVSGNILTASWHVAPGYHLYKQRINFSSPTLKLQPPVLPKGSIWQDPQSGKYSVLQGEASVQVPFSPAPDQETHIFAGYQGCADSGFCYPPIVKDIVVQLSPLGQQVVSITDADLATMPLQVDVSEQGKIANLFLEQQWGAILLLLFGLGILLAFTPCVLPMVPILSSLIVGQKQLSTWKAFTLSLAYVLAMAVTYAIAGVIMGSVGGSVQASLQQPWVLIVFSALFVVLALSMFGLYELRLPQGITERLTQVSQRQRGGQYLGVALMGVLSALIVSPCISAPLVGVLAYIARTGNATFGGLALFVLALGMGLPLLVVGTLGGRFLPRRGNWMQRVKHFCGFLLLLVAVYLLTRLVSEATALIAYGILALAVAGYLVSINKVTRVLAAIVAIYGGIAVVGGIVGHQDPFRPWLAKPVTQLSFIPVKTAADVQQQLAKAQGKYVLLDFYADWCVSCKIMERTVFGNPDVQAKLKDYVLLQADVTANDQQDKALEQAFGVYGPPTILLFDPQGKLRGRIVGETSAQQLLAQLPV